MTYENKIEWIETVLYPELFYHIDTAFPEFEFKKKGNNWYSSNTLKITGERGEKGKVIVWANAPFCLKDFTRGNIGILKYVQERDNLDFKDAVAKLAEHSNIQIPNFTNLTNEAIQNNLIKSTILEDANDYFTYCLTEADNVQSKRVLDYLKSRRYSLAEIKAMGLGYIPNNKQILNYLVTQKGHNEKLVQESLNLNSGIWNSIGINHTLSIPFRSTGKLKGFNVRNIDYEKGKGAKYLNTLGENDKQSFFNQSALKGDKDLIIVEGELDSLHATVKGIKNVVATGGSSINAQQIQNAIKRGAKKITLCFDTEKGKEETTEETILKSIEMIQSQKIENIYVVNLPLIGEKTDVDSFISEKGVDEFQKIIDTALPYYEYQLRSIFNRYEGKESTPKKIDDLLEETVLMASRINNLLHKDTFIHYFLAVVEDLGLTKESISITIENLKIKKEKEAQKKSLNKLLADVKNLQQKEQITEALNLLEAELQKVRLEDKSTEFQALLSPTTEAQIIAEEQHTPEGLSSGFSIGEEEIDLPAGAITVYAAPTGHGKTLLLINTLINVARKYKDKKFVFFSYEEKANSILQYVLNTYVDTRLSKNNRKALKSYFKTGSDKYIADSSKAIFQELKNDFFQNYIETGRILVKGVDYNSQELDLAIRYLHKNEPNIGAIFIDYFQLLNLPDDVKKEKRIGQRQEELKTICQDLNKLAKNTGLPIVLAAQFNRQATNILKLIPTNLSEAGDIERIVNTLIGLWQIGKVASGDNKELSYIEKKIYNENGIQNDIENGERFIYAKLLKSRELETGGYSILDFNGNTGKIENKKNTSFLTEIPPF